MVFLSRYFSSWRKRRAIRSYVRRLPRLLARDYGAAKTYTPQQVRRTVERHGLDTTYSCYAVSMFSGRDDFNEYHQSIGETCDFDMMRGEIADYHFHSNADFTTADVAQAFSDSGHSGHSGHDGGWGGDSGGGGGDGGGGGGD